jgi:hypothetical protein
VSFYQVVLTDKVLITFCSSDMSAARHADILFVKDRKDNGERRVPLIVVSMAHLLFPPL